MIGGLEQIPRGNNRIEETSGEGFLDAGGEVIDDPGIPCCSETILPREKIALDDLDSCARRLSDVILESPCGAGRSDEAFDVRESVPEKRFDDSGSNESARTRDQNWIFEADNERSIWREAVGQ